MESNVTRLLTAGVEDASSVHVRKKAVKNCTYSFAVSRRCSIRLSDFCSSSCIQRTVNTLLYVDQWTHSTQHQLIQLHLYQECERQYPRDFNEKLFNFIIELFISVWVVLMWDLHMWWFSTHRMLVRMRCCSPRTMTAASSLAIFLLGFFSIRWWNACSSFIPPRKNRKVLEDEIYGIRLKTIINLIFDSGKVVFE